MGKWVTTNSVLGVTMLKKTLTIWLSFIKENRTFLVSFDFLYSLSLTIDAFINLLMISINKFMS